MSDSKQAWKDGLGAEKLFWKTWLGNRAMSQAYVDAHFAKPRWVQDHILDAIPARYADGQTLRLLEVGAGPAPILGNSLADGREVHLVAIDPLANFFNELLDSLGLVPPVRVQQMAGEELDSVFAPEVFHYAYANNCLDHAVDPLKCVLGMVRVTKPGCTVQLRHKTNEAVTQHKAGLHQWNFELVDGKFHIWSETVRHCVDDLLAGACTCTHYLDGIWINTRIVKV